MVCNANEERELQQSDTLTVGSGKASSSSGKSEMPPGLHFTFVPYVLPCAGPSTPTERPKQLPELDFLWGEADEVPTARRAAQPKVLAASKAGTLRPPAWASSPADGAPDAEASDSGLGTPPLAAPLAAPVAGDVLQETIAAAQPVPEQQVKTRVLAPTAEEGLLDDEVNEPDDLFAQSGFRKNKEEGREENMPVMPL